MAEFILLIAADDSVVNINSFRSLSETHQTIRIANYGLNCLPMKLPFGVNPKIQIRKKAFQITQHFESNGLD